MEISNYTKNRIVQRKLRVFKIADKSIGTNNLILDDFSQDCLSKAQLSVDKIPSLEGKKKGKRRGR